MELKYHYMNGKGNQYNNWKSGNFIYDTDSYKLIYQYFSVVRTAIKNYQ